MTVLQLAQRLARCQNRCKVLRDDNQRLWESREQWKRKHRARGYQNTYLRRRVRLLERYIARYRHCPVLSRPPEWKNIHLSEQDLQRILRMPVRD